MGFLAQMYKFRELYTMLDGFNSRQGSVTPRQRPLQALRLWYVKSLVEEPKRVESATSMEHNHRQRDCFWILDFGDIYVWDNR